MTTARIEFSYEANAAMGAVMENLTLLANATVNTKPAQLSTEKDVEGFLRRLGKASLAAVRAFDLFVASVSESARTTGVFPTVLPKRPQPTSLGSDGSDLLSGNSSPRGTERKAAGGIPSLPRLPSAATPHKNVPPKVVTAPPLPSPASTARPNNASVASPSATRGASDQENAATIVATGAYMLLDILVREVMAREAFWYSVAATSSDGGGGGAADEAAVIALYSAKPRAPSAARIPLRTGIVGAVIRSGLAINVAPDAPSETNPLAICFPVFPPGRTYPIGAVALYSKATDTAFTAADEAITASWATLAGRYMTEYGVDLTKTHLDPFKCLLRVTSPLAHYVRQGYSRLPYDPANQERAAEASEARLLTDLLADAARVIEMQTTAPAGGGAGAESEQSKRQQSQRLKAAAIQSYSARLATTVASFPPPVRVFHAAHHNHFTVARGAHIGGGGVALRTRNLIDVADYVHSLEDLWKRTAEDLQSIEEEHVAHLDDFRARKRKLKTALARTAELERERNDVAAKYDSLKLELSTICGRPVVDGTLDDIHAALRGGTSSFVK